MRPASSGGSRGTSGTPCRQNMGIDPSVAIRRGEGAHRKWCRELWCFPRVRPVCQGTLGVASRVPSTVLYFRMERGTSLDTLKRPRASSCDDGGTTWFSSSCSGIFELRREIQVSSCVVPGKSILPFEVRGRAGDCTRVTSGQMRPHLCLCLGPNVPLQGRQGSRGCIPDSPEESGLVYRGSKEFRSPLESQRVSLEPTEWPKGSQASCGV